MTSELEKDLYMLQWSLNGNLAAGSDQVKRAEIATWLDPDSNAVFEAPQDWQRLGYITILKDPRRCKDKEFCLKIIKPISALEAPADLLDDV